MPPSSWQKIGDYSTSNTLPGNTLAWEYLARNPRYLSDLKQLKARAKKSPITEHDRAEFAMRWGVLFERGKNSKVSWAASAYPGSMFVVNAIPETIIGKPFALPFANGAGTYVVGDVSVTLIRKELGNSTSTSQVSYAILVPLDELIDVRLRAVKHLADHLSGKQAKPFPPPMSEPQRNRLIDGLRALDRHAAGASYREIATELFGEAAVAKRSWKQHDLRDRTIRLVRDAVRMMRGGYRQLLLHPYRRRLPEGD
jgi:Uncharacterized conserved protein (DUF2285)/Family of unknown function (DUF6499)